MGERGLSVAGKRRRMEWVGLGWAVVPRSGFFVVCLMGVLRLDGLIQFGSRRTRAHVVGKGILAPFSVQRRERAVWLCGGQEAMLYSWTVVLDRCCGDVR